MVSARFRDAVLALEPDHQQFVPVPIFHKDGETSLEGQYFLWNPATLCDAIDPACRVEPTGDNPENSLW